MGKTFTSFNLFLPSVNSALRSQNQYLEVIGIVGLCLYAFAFPFSKGICYVGEWMMIGAFLFSMPYVWSKMKHDPIWIGVLALFGYLVFKGIWTFFVYQEPVFDILDAIRFRLRFLHIFIIAWWIGGTKESLLRILGISLIGFIVLLGIGFDTRILADYGRGLRVGFGINPQHFALYTTTALCGCLFLARDFWGTSYKHFRILLWTVLIYLFFELIIRSQTRTIWVAIVVILIFYGIVSLLSIHKRSKLRGRKRVFLWTCGFLFALFLVFQGVHFHSDTINKRLSMEYAAANELFFSDSDNITAESLFGVRATLWKWSIEKIRYRPFTGWKIDDTSKDYIGQSVKTDESISHFSHVHNSYLEILLNQGMIGLLLYLFFPVYVFYSVIMRFKQGEIPYRLFLFFCSFIILFGIANISEAYITSWLFWPYFTTILGGFYSLVLWRRLPVNEGLA